MRVLFVIIGIIALVTTVLALMRKEAWWIRLFDFPRVQILLLALSALSGYPIVSAVDDRWEYMLLSALMAAACYQAYKILPYATAFKKEVQSSRAPRPESCISLLTANVLMHNRRADRLLQIIKTVEPDIILTVETDAWWDAQLQALAATYPYSVRQPLDNTYGLLLYSRLELVDPEIRFLVEDDIPSVHTIVKLRSGQRLEFHGLHPRPPFPTESPTAVERDAELLIVGKSVKRSQLPIIVMGDLNDVAWSRTTRLFQKISGLLDPRIGRGLFNTFHAKIPFLRCPIDHIFHSNHFRLIELKRLPYFGSDHFPMFVTLSLEDDAKQEQVRHHPDPAERQEAEEKIEKAA